MGKGAKVISNSVISLILFVVVGSSGWAGI
jgi:hypothetical protein